MKFGDLERSVATRGRTTWQEFKSFAIKGNAIDLAVGVIIGTAFGGIVTSLVQDLIMPPMSFITGGLDYTNKFILLRAAPDGATLFTSPAAAKAAGAVTWNYGNFLTLAVQFAISAFCIFLLVKVLAKLKQPAPNAVPAARECPFCTMTISVKAVRCPHCTSELAKA